MKKLIEGKQPSDKKHKKAKDKKLSKKDLKRIAGGGGRAGGVNILN